MADTDNMADKARWFNVEQGKEMNKNLRSIGDSLRTISLAQQGSADKDEIYLAMLDGTKETYERVQKAWFKANGAGDLNGTTSDTDAAKLTELVDKWYKMTRESVSDWDGWVRFYHPSVSPQSTGDKMGDLKGMECVPSTTEEENRDDFAGNPLFAITTCNWKMSEAKPIITAIKGISSDFEQDNPDKYVGVLQMTGWHYWTELDESGTYYDEGYRATYKKHTHIEPLPEAVGTDNKSVREWVLHGKYPIGLKDDGSYTCCSGVNVAWQNMNHNTMNAKTMALENGISAAVSCDWSFLKLMNRLKYGSLATGANMNGCLAYWCVADAQIAETNVKRIIVPSVAMNQFVVGSSVRIGNNDGANKDTWRERNAATLSITGKDAVKITAIEKVTIDGTDYTAIYVDTDAAFDTVASEGNVTSIYSFPWATGSTDDVKGNDGGIAPSSVKCPIMIQGIEFELGQHEVLSDVILNLYQDEINTENYYYQPYVVKDANKRSTALTADYVACDAKLMQGDVSNWHYIKHEKYSQGFYFPDVVGGSSSTYLQDGIYMNAKTVEKREVFAFGGLGTGAAIGGLSSLDGGGGLGFSSFLCGSRLSPNGTRGSWTA